MLEAELFYRNGFSSKVYFSLFLDVFLVFNVIVFVQKSQLFIMEWQFMYMYGTK